MKITFLTLFPEFFDSFRTTSIINKAVKKGAVELDAVNLRNYSDDKNKRVDDTTIGGGPGLILKCDSLIKAIKDLKKENTKVIFMSSRGKIYNQKRARKLASSGSDLVLISGHYEGIDERVLSYVDEELCVGEYILTGGEIPSMIVADSVIRLLDGAITEESHLDESYENGLLEYPQYTLPRVYDGKEIPEILLTGNHEAIRMWRLKESLRATISRRKDMLKDYKFNKEELKLLEEIKDNRVGRWEYEAIKKNKRIKIHSLKIDGVSLNLIKANEKSYEILEFNDKSKAFNINDEICFVNKMNANDYCYRKINSIKTFESVDEVLKKHTIVELGVSSKEALYKEHCNKVVLVELI